MNNWPIYTEEEIDAVSSILKSSKVNYWTGREGYNFEEEFKNYVGSKYALTASNGTLSLYLAYSAIGLGEDDEIITTPRGYIATASLAVQLKAKVLFAEVDENSGLINAETIEPLITKRTKAIVVVHIGGWPADMPSIIKLAKTYNLLVIEDCAQAHGAKIESKSVGSFGDISAWSFCHDKIISTGGEGGMVTTNDKNYLSYMWSFRDHGKSRELAMSPREDPGYRWLHENIGSNFRMTEIQSAIGRIQLKQLDARNRIRFKNAKIIIESLKNIKAIRIPIPEEKIISGWYKLYAYIDKKALKSEWSRNRILQEINMRGYPAFSGTCPEIYKEGLFANDTKYKNINLPIARELGETSLMFLIHPTITNEQMNNYSKMIKDVIEKAIN